MPTSKRQLFDGLYELHSPLLFGYLIKNTRSKTQAEDILQEAFLKLFEQLKKEKKIENFRAYLFQIARHILYRDSMLRKKTEDNEGGSAIDEKSKSSPVIDEPDQKLIRRELEYDLIEASFLLKDEHREIFELRWNFGMKQKEIATILKKSDRQIRRDLENIIMQLRDYFGKKGWDMNKGMPVN